MHQGPVLARGAAGTWDDVDLLNPSVVKFKGKLFNYYSAYDGALWRTGVATSDDGITWTKYENNPVLEPSTDGWDTQYIAANGSALLWRDKIFYFFHGMNDQGKHAIGLATSEDGFNFTKEPYPVLEPGLPGAWDSMGVADPYVVRDGDGLSLYFLGQNEQSTQRIGIAQSSDGRTWAKHIANPILDAGAAGTFDENGIGEPSIAYHAPYYYLIYTGRDADENRNIGYALSSDGVHFRKISTDGLLNATQRGEWASHVVCDTTLLPRGDGTFDVWFGGGDMPEPAENLHGQVGYLRLNLQQGRDMSEFDANANWADSKTKSSDVLQGSFGPQGEPGERMVWVGQRAQITLLPDSHQLGRSLVVSGWMPARTIREGTKDPSASTLTLFVEGREVASEDYLEDEFFSISIPWEQVQEDYVRSGIVKLEMHASRFFVPALISDSGDRRALAFQISSIRFGE